MAPIPNDPNKKRKAAIGAALAAGVLFGGAAITAISRAQLGKNEFQVPPTEPVPFAAVAFGLGRDYQDFAASLPDAPGR